VNPGIAGGSTYHRVLKAADSTAYLGLFWLTWRFLDDRSHWDVPVGAAALSGCWLLLTFLRTRHLLKTYFDVLSRLEFTAPALLGVSLALFALVEGWPPALRGAAAGELVAWASLTALYRRNRRRYVRQGHGPLPSGCWISPPAEALAPGDLILTSGRVAAGLRESVGHGETVLRSPGGALESFSSYMDQGAVLHPVGEYASALRQHGHYVVLRLKDGLTDEQVRHAEQIAREMIAENRRWRDAVNARRRRILGRLPLPRRLREALAPRLESAGYDWVGLFMGRLAPHRWTCIGACLELYRRLGIPTDSYGTGLLGFGTTLLDPIMPVRFLSDPAFRLLSTPDRDATGDAGGARPL
jgi:hypothetical protein